ncbi:MAG: hypothetical protein IPP91_20320 [Betaproteobacteria bacterium]|nr:hypothetical protein [Betaproteobacteria bacterium]
MDDILGRRSCSRRGTSPGPTEASLSNCGSYPDGSRILEDFHEIPAEGTPSRRREIPRPATRCGIAISAARAESQDGAGFSRQD